MQPSDTVSIVGNPPRVTSSAFLRGCSKLLVVCTLILIFKGSLVTSHDAGLSVPDWPTSYGQNMFLYPPSEWVGAIFFEHVHRLIASGVGLLTLIFTAWTFAVESRRAVRRLTALALLAVCAQGLLGGLTVIYKLPVLVSALHAVLAQTFLVMTIVIAYLHSAEYQQRRTLPAEAFNSRRMKGAIHALGFIYLQLIVGAVMRHSGSGLAIPDFPTMGGSLLPSLSDTTLASINELRLLRGLHGVETYQVALHLAHRFVGYTIAIALMALSFSALRRQYLHANIRSTAATLGGLVMIQILLGAFSVWTVREPWITSLHVICGAALLALATILVLRTTPYEGTRDE